MMRNRRGTWALMAVLIGIGCLPLYLFSLSLYAERGNRFDIYPRYIGAQAAWAGESPYSQAVTERIQLGMYGRVQPPDADQQAFAHPAYSAVLLAPLLLLPPAVAIPVWLTLQMAALLATPFLWLSLLGWRPRPLLTVVLIIGVIFIYRYPILAFLWGQFTGGVVFLVSLALLLLARRRDAWAGAALALATMPPSVGAVLAVGLIGVLLLAGRWRAMIGFVGLLGAATLISLGLVGWWLPDFLNGLAAYAVYAHPVLALDYLPPLVRPLLFIGLVGAVGFAGWRARSALTSAEMRGRLPRALFTFVFALTLAFLLLLPQTGNYTLVLGIPILMTAAYDARRGGPWALVTRLLIVITLFSPWPWVALGLPDIETLVTPVLLGLTLLAGLRAADV